jgi:hypothetical protein
MQGHRDVKNGLQSLIDGSAFLADITNFMM